MSTAPRHGGTRGNAVRHGPAMTDLAFRRYRNRYRDSMAMNLRMEPDLAEALRALADETGRSQQDLVREAIDLFVREYRLRDYPPTVRHLITAATRPVRHLPEDQRAPVPQGWDATEVIRAMRTDR